MWSVDPEPGGIVRWKSSKVPSSKDVHSAFLVLAGQGEDTLKMVLQSLLSLLRGSPGVGPSMRDCNRDVRVFLLCGSSPEK